MMPVRGYRHSELSCARPKAFYFLSTRDNDKQTGLSEFNVFQCLFSLDRDTIQTVDYIIEWEDNNNIHFNYINR